MRPAAIVLAGWLAACSGPPALVLPGKLDLPVASSDALKLCPDDGMEDTTPDSDCVLSSAKNASAPYENSLTRMGWKPEPRDGQLLWWVSPVGTDGSRSCLAIKPQITNAARREGVLLEFTVRAAEAGATCSPR